MSDRGRSRSPRRGGDRRDRQPGYSVLVRNLPLDAHPGELYDMFGEFGKVLDVYIPRDYYSRRPKGFGFVEFANERDAEEAIYRLDRVRLGGRELTVLKAQETRKAPDDMRSRDQRDGGRRPRSRSRDDHDRRRTHRRRRSPTRSRSPSRHYRDDHYRDDRREPSPPPTDRYNKSDDPSFDDKINDDDNTDRNWRS